MADRRLGLASCRRLTTLWGASLLAFFLATSPRAYAQENSFLFQINPQSMQSALLEFSEQAGIQLILATDARDIAFMDTLSGNMQPRDALERMLAGTMLQFEFTGDNTVTVTRRAPETVDTGEAGPTEDIARFSPESPSIEEIVLVGTRTEGRSVLETPVPIDVVTSNAMADTGQFEVGRMLQILAPSFNFSTSAVSDGTDALRPATLRGLGPDQTLVLINGKRRHAAALVHVNTSVGRGTAGVDMNAVPGSALAGVEILRDGAAAQYGSDAIAGVINLRLKEASEGGEFVAHYGQTYEGDGATMLASVNVGFQLANEGFLNITAEYSDRGDTNRAGLTGAVQYPLLESGGACDAFDNSACDPREFTFDRKNFRIGDADSEHKAFVVNAKLPLADNAAMYTFGTFSRRDSQSAGFYRRASEYENTVLELYPDGFLPLINTDIEDYSVTAGVEWIPYDNWSVDMSVNHGANQFQFIISNSLNASFGSQSPTRADAGTLGAEQTSFNLDTVGSFELAGRQSTLALGMEYREENYSIRTGEPVSYSDGGARNTNCTGCLDNPVMYASGFQVFRGFSPENEVDEKRHNISLYADVETKVTPNWLLTAAVRFEDYSDFGNKLTGKFSTRIKLNDWLSVRASVSSGFRAPAMQQKFFNSVSTQFVEPNVAMVNFDDVGTVAQQRGTFRNDSLVAQLAGVPPLKEETSFNYSTGIMVNTGRFTMTLDGYRIDIEDRIGISGAIDLMQTGFENLGGAASSGQFFVNAADTQTTGVDFVATYDVALAGDHNLLLTATANWTETEVDRGTLVTSIGNVDVGPLFTPQDISIIEEWQPKTRISLSANYSAENWSLIARINQFGSYTVCEGSCDNDTNIQKFGSKVLADFQISYRFPDAGLKFTAGANNVFDTYPDVNLIGQSRAGTIAGIVSSPGVFQYSRRSAPFGFNGGFWYARVTYNF